MLFEDKKNVPNKSKIIFFLILFLSLFIKSFPMYIQSFDADYFSISENLKQKLGLLYPLKEEYINSPEIIKINTDTISADQDHSIKLKLPYKTGDLGTDIMELLYVKKSGKLLQKEMPSLPLGILNEARFSKDDVLLTKDDWIVMVSDGVMIGSPEWIEKLILSWRDGSAEQLAARIVNEAQKRRRNDHDDDITAIAMRVVVNA